MKRAFLCQPIDSCRTCVSIGPPGAGKSFIMLNCLYEWLEYGMFDEYILILPTYGIEQNSSYDFLKNYKNVTIYTGYHPKIAERIIKQQKKDVKHEYTRYTVDEETRQRDRRLSPKRAHAITHVRSCVINQTSRMGEVSPKTLHSRRAPPRLQATPLGRRQLLNYPRDEVLIQ